LPPGPLSAPPPPLTARTRTQTPPPKKQPTTQENCGATGELLRCSRCHAAWFCSLPCHKAYWPFHSAACRPNHFADAAERQGDAKFAAWMRGHGRLAVLQDEQVIWAFCVRGCGFGGHVLSVLCANKQQQNKTKHRSSCWSARASPAAGRGAGATRRWT
jgi:hypothetical protein